MQGNKQWSRQSSAPAQVSGVSQFSHEGKQAQFLLSPVGNEYFQNTEEPLPLGKKRKVYTLNGVIYVSFLFTNSQFSWFSSVAE